MEWLNYHHLLYFWLAAKEGGIALAAAELRLAPPTVSSQIHLLEDALGERLFERRGRRLVLTEMGRVVYRFADEIFAMGRELLDTVRGRPTGRPLRLVVGVADVVDKLIVRRLLEPALRLDVAVELTCREDESHRLLPELVTHALDVVITDAPVGAAARIRAFSHLLGESGVSLFAGATLAKRLRRRVPRSLDGAPFLLPMETTGLRRSLEQWFESNLIRPRIIGEFQDSALLRAFAEDGHSVFAAPTAVEREVEKYHGVVVFARLPSVRERFYAITVHKRIQHPAVVAISEAARREPLGG